MTTGTRLDHLTRFDLSAAADDVTAILSAERPRAKGLADSLYREALTRSLQRSAHRKPQKVERQPETAETPRRKPDSAQKPSRTETKAGIKPPADKLTPAEKTDRASENTQNQQPASQKPAPRAAEEPTKTATTPDQHTREPEDPSVRINAEPGTPPAQFQPITVTTGAAEDGQVQFDGSLPGGSHADDPVEAAENASAESEDRGRGPQHARTVIESLHARFDAAADQPNGQNQGPPSPPAGLFQALASISARIEGESPSSGNEQTQPASDIPLQAVDPDADGSAIDEAVGFDSTPSDSDTRLASVVTTEDVSTGDLQAGLDSDLVDEANPADSEETGEANQQNNVAEGEAKNFSGLEKKPEFPENAGLPGRQPAGGDPPDPDGAPSSGTSPRQTAPSAEKNHPVRTAEPALTINRTVSHQAPSIEVAETAVQSAPPAGAAPAASTPAPQRSSGDSATLPPEASARGGTPSETAKQAGARSAEPPLRLVDRIAEAVRQAGRGGQQLKIRLNPPELGALQIEVATRNGGLIARLEVQTPAAQQQITENLHLLRETLAQNGTPVERIDVQLNESWRDHPSSGFGGRQQPEDEHPSQQNPQQNPGDPEPETPNETDADDPFNPSAQTEQLDIHV